jgi:hypothetical protein
MSARATWPRAGCGALYGSTLRETEHAAFSLESRPDLSKNAGLLGLDSLFSSFPIETKSGS